MKIIITETDTADRGPRQVMEIDGRESLHVCGLCDCPEDAIIGRDLVDCQQVADFMELAYNAGKQGEEFSIVFNGPKE
jgi:hypothetical protein